MNHLKDLIHRLRAGESERRISLDLKISRPTVHKYFLLAKQKGFLDLNTPFPEEAVLLASAALDRLTHHAHTLIIRGDSYRQRSRRKETSSATN